MNLNRAFWSARRAEVCSVQFVVGSRQFAVALEKNYWQLNCVLYIIWRWCVSRECLVVVDQSIPESLLMTPGTTDNGMM